MTYHGDLPNVYTRLKRWAYPTNEQIAEHLGVSVNTLKELKQILATEKLLMIKKREYKGIEKDYYFPLYYRDNNYNN
ncbi:Mn-dependent DtxR family transcriptional regulator [Peribacillus deserti]|uniref:Mn-dependent DtxR family transcriptional regulator n=1 Tax=Peribacillus deserti TaxID=673318 RepID=A0ABS2QER1_9BACI|nr:Mn-dependent DtxR family transcriptional regulator [Peribacillus deserti]